MNLFDHFTNRKPTDIYIQTEKATYTYGDLFEFNGDFEESFLREELSVIALKIKDQVTLAFCIWSCLYYEQSFILLPHQLDETLEKQLLKEADCRIVITTKESKKPSSFLIQQLTYYEIKEIALNLEKKQSAAIGFISSGTTGKPKLIWNTHSQFEKSLESIRTNNFMPYCKNQQVLISPFLTHSYGFSALLEYTQGNSTIFIPSEASFAGVFGLITNKKTQSQITAIEGVPYFYKQVLVFQKKIHFSNLKHLGFGGDFVHETLLKSLREVYQSISFSVRYGISEIPSVIGLNRFKNLDKNTNTYTILPEYTIKIDDEILVRYKNDTKIIATGDIGFMKDGRLYIIDRKASFLKVKGYKVSPNYIEKIILDSGMIQEVHVLTKNDTLIAQIIPQVNFDKVGLKNYLRSKLPQYAIPDRITEVKSIERTSTGKISRK